VADEEELRRDKFNFIVEFVSLLVSVFDIGGDVAPDDDAM